MSRIKLADISALTLYQDEYTSSKRGKSIPQLVCKGKPCKSFTPDVVRCVNLGGEGTDVDWKCETNLPESLLLGRVQVSCEGWSGPGDSHVLKGSCSLEYRLQEVPKVYRPDSHSHSSKGSFTSEALMCYLDALFIGILAFILYKLLYPRFEGRHRVSPPRTPRPDLFPSPPPYSMFPPDTDNATGSQVRDDQDDFGFWSSVALGGAVLGGLGAYLLTRQGESDQPQPRQYDQENERYLTRPDPVPVPRASGSSSQQQSWESREGCREGLSNLGSMRRSTFRGNL
ncbi:hypothetical protein EDB84DRAFT_1486961 [Lactarius hengduanensis]|nr:hypothetical protein EDB84DRAFT_1486961 [Lactarius hengduanensis]